MTKFNPSARQAALAARDAYQSKPTSLISYQSNGRVIVLTDESLWQQCESLSSPLKPFGVLNSLNNSPVTSATNVVPLASRNVEIKGHLGDFEVKLIDKLGQADVLKGDLILDLNPRPLLKMDMPPPGYLHVAAGDFDFDGIQQHLLDMTGGFEKPKYFNYDPSICAHGVNGNTVCSRCIDACPAGAIFSAGEEIEVDPFLCQGGGTCASVCPSGAMRYVYPSHADNGNRVRKMLQAYRQQGGDTAILVFYVEPEMELRLLEIQADVLPIQVEEIASVGMELCLSSLVYGATQVVLLVNQEAAQSSVQKLEQQLEWLYVALAGLGIEQQRISIQRGLEEFAPFEMAWPLPVAEYSMPENKRHALFQGLDHLHQKVEKSSDMVSLPAGAPFGSAIIDADACTLCMACVGACPGKALQDGSNREIPEILFIESQCLQCGACTNTCPERAISLLPRIIFDREQRNRARMLHQDAPFACIQCGKPFATASVIDKMSFSLKDHYMFQSDRAMDRLKMCEDCRVADIVQDPEAMNGNYDAIKSDSGKGLS